METTKCKIFARTAQGYVDVNEEMELNLVQYGVLFIEVNGKKVIGFAISESLVAVPVSLL